MKKTKTMIRTMIRTFAIALAAGAVISAKAYIAEPGDLVVSIPFHFEAGQKTMPAGDYVVRFDTDQTTLRVCEDGMYCTAIQGVAFDLIDAGHAAQVVFENSGGQMRLSRVSASSGRGVEVRNSELAELGSRAATPWTIVTVPAREICIHRHVGTTLSPAWH
jgi:hypothetical protein